MFLIINSREKCFVNKSAGFPDRLFCEFQPPRLSRFVEYTCRELPNVAFSFRYPASYYVRWPPTNQKICEWSIRLLVVSINSDVKRTSKTFECRAILGLCRTECNGRLGNTPMPKFWTLQGYCAAASRPTCFRTTSPISVHINVEIFS